MELAYAILIALGLLSSPDSGINSTEIQDIELTDELIISSDIDVM